MSASGPSLHTAPLTALILAGGLGTRLASVVKDRPKVMAEVLGRPWLAHQLDWLGEQGIRKVVLCTGYLEEQIRAHFGAAYEAIELAYSHETSPLGTGGALAQAVRQVIGGESAPLLALNGDSLFRVDLQPFWAWYQDRVLRNALLLSAVEDAGRFGGVRLAEDGHILAFDEKGRSGPGLVNAGVYLLDPALLRALPLDRPTSLEREVFPGLCGRDLHGFPAQGPFLDIGTPESYARAESFLNHRKDTP